MGMKPCPALNSQEYETFHKKHPNLQMGARFETIGFFKILQIDPLNFY